ncbi:hypothetical protein HOY81_02770 [Streptomyces sp. JJ36]|nr:hypothetical protein [Streptomyces sp. JJ36]
MSGLLFLALAFFAVAQAATVRNGGQSAADAAALAAAREDRDRFFDGFLDSLGEGDGWQRWLDLSELVSADGCGAAGDFAGRNDASVLRCEPVFRHGRPGYTVTVETNYDTGNTVIPGADDRTATAEATAVVRPSCEFDAEEKEIELDCKNGDFDIDPDDEEIDVEPSDLFSVVLTE